MRELANESSRKLEQTRRDFELYTQNYNRELLQKMYDAFNCLDEGYMLNDYNQASDGLEMISNIIGETTMDINEEYLISNWKVGV